MSLTETEPGLTGAPGARRPHPGGGPAAEDDRSAPVALVVVALVAAAVGGVLRFVMSSPLWLDEALSVSISTLPLADIPEALRRDGHPPLYYVLLHYWTEAFGTGAAAVRALSGVVGLASMALAWVVGRRRGGDRLAWLVLLVVATSPFAVRYATETRMYALVMLEVLAGMLLLDEAHRRAADGRSTTPALVGLALVGAALLWTHYWSMWLLAALGLRSLWVAWRSDDPARRALSLRVVAAIVGAGLLFLPWVPALLYQSAHTGTPWAEPSRPTDIVAVTTADLGGGGYRDAQTVGWFFVMLAVFGVLGRAVDRRRIELDLRTVPQFRPEAAVIAGTILIGSVVSFVTASAYASRYAAVVVPIFLLLVAGGLTRFRSVPVLVGLSVVVAAGGIAGGVANARADRTQMGVIASTIERRADPGDLVVYCPDQLGPAGSRVVPDDLDEVVYPTGGPPERVDWVDYAERNEAADPVAFAADLLERAGDHRIFLVWNPSYRTFEDQCEALFGALASERFAVRLVDAEGGQYFENANLTVFRAP